MALQRKDKPDWFALIDKVKAIRELGEAASRDLARHLGVHESRTTEWICGLREAKAQKVLEIQEWVAAMEDRIRTKGKIAAYSKIVKRLSKE